MISAYKDRIDTLNPSVKKIEEEEKLEKSMRQAEKELEKTENKLKKGEDEREGRIWFQSKQAKQQEKSRIFDTILLYGPHPRKFTIFTKNNIFTKNFFVRIFSLKTAKLAKNDKFFL